MESQQHQVCPPTTGPAAPAPPAGAQVFRARWWTPVASPVADVPSALPFLVTGYALRVTRYV